MATLSERLRDGWLDADVEAAETIDALVEALEMAERHMVGMWNGINPHATYEGGNRMADKDLVMQEVRAALSRARGDNPADS